MIATAEELCDIIRHVGGVVGFTSGCFDLFHYYHLHYLERCKAECDYLVVGVDADALLTKNKHKQAVFPEYHRASLINAQKCVNAVFVMRNLRQFHAVADKANVIFKNAPMIYGRPVNVPKEKLMVIPDVEELQSTTAILKRIRRRKRP